ncbi:hypothetical protein QAD02_010595 [Eretmocerus hayati]|uniref:Uncharacterized protein n=1 Tax=Eretmocerus hayati TaxID=131215 RepID=A0ACC2NWZ5_9HYME|nr:hypothetical protein QAD02_010595 [Eretmocerus hayati]
MSTDSPTGIRDGRFENTGEFSRIPRRLVDDSLDGAMYETIKGSFEGAEGEENGYGASPYRASQVEKACEKLKGKNIMNIVKAEEGRRYLRAIPRNVSGPSGCYPIRPIPPYVQK